MLDGSLSHDHQGVRTVMGRARRGLTLALLLILSLSACGLAGCGGGIKEGGPPPGATYAPPSDLPKNEPEKGAPK
jgi:hypothetical protein